MCRLLLNKQINEYFNLNILHFKSSVIYKNTRIKISTNVVTRNNDRECSTIDKKNRCRLLCLRYTGVKSLGVMYFTGRFIYFFFLSLHARPLFNPGEPSHYKRLPGQQLFNYHKRHTPAPWKSAFIAAWS